MAVLGVVLCKLLLVQLFKEGENMIVFNINGDFHGVFSSLPNKDYLNENEWIIAEFDEDESFDHRYSYTSVEGIAVRGDLIPVDLEEEARMESEIQATKYQQDRQFKYPSIQDQLDDLYHNGIDGWKSSIKTIKDAYPKPKEL